MKRKDPKNWEQIPRKIFVILFENTKSFFVNDTTQVSNWKFYDEHYRERCEATRAQFALCKSQDKLPPIFYLGTVTGTKSDTFQRKLEWSKYFVAHGFKPLTGPKMEEIIDEFDPETSEFYASIKDIPLSELCAPEKNLLPNFKQMGKQKRTENSKLKPDEHKIELIINQKEYERYKKIASEYGVSMSEYLLECARYGGHLEVDTSFLERYINQIDDCYNVFAGMLATYLVSGSYLPADIKMMETVSKEIAKSNDSVKNEIIRFCRQLGRMKRGEKSDEDVLL